MPKNDNVYAGHMLDKSRQAMELVKNKNRADYDNDPALRFALAHLVQVIGEAARRVSPDFQSEHPEVPWNEIIGMRHKIVHDYMDVDEDIVWAVVSNDLQPLIEKLKGFLGED